MRRVSFAAGAAAMVVGAEPFRVLCRTGYRQQLRRHRQDTGVLASGRRLHQAAADWRQGPPCRRRSAERGPLHGDGRGTGARRREVLLPGAGEATVKTVTAGPDGRLVAVGDRGYAGPAGWVSTDGGAHWQAANMPKTGGTPQLWTVVHDGQQYMALGGVDGEQRAAALVLISYDGLTWHRDDTAANAGARLMTAAVALPDGTVYAAAGTGPNAQMPNEQCAVVWRWDGQRWVEPVSRTGR